jgi:hypothetical protein
VTYLACISVGVLFLRILNYLQRIRIIRCPLREIDQAMAGGPAALPDQSHNLEDTFVKTLNTDTTEK